MENISLKIQPRAPVVLGIAPRAPITVQITSGHTVDWYEGPYEVTPTRFEQYLATKDKTMRADVNVHEIPYYETANPYGTTYIIGE